MVVRHIYIVRLNYSAREKCLQKKKHNEKSRWESELENYCSPVLARLVSTAVWFTARRIYSVNSVRRYVSLKNPIVPWKRSNFYTAPRAGGSQSFLFMSADEEWNVTFSFAFTSTDMKQKCIPTRSDWFKKKRKNRRNAGAICLVDWIYLREGGTNIIYTKTINNSVCPSRWMCASEITKVFFVFKRTDSAFFFYL